MNAKVENQVPEVGLGEISAWIADYIARVVEKDARTLSDDAPFESFGLDSVSIVGMTGDLGKWLGREVDPTVVYDHPSIAGLAKYLVENAPAKARQ